jgi:hypothetical protein
MYQPYGCNNQLITARKSATKTPPNFAKKCVRPRSISVQTLGKFQRLIKELFKQLD